MGHWLRNITLGHNRTKTFPSSLTLNITFILNNHHFQYSLHRKTVKLGMRCRADTFPSESTALIRIYTLCLIIKPTHCNLKSTVLIRIYILCLIIKPTHCNLKSTALIRIYILCLIIKPTHCNLKSTALIRIYILCLIIKPTHCNLTLPHWTSTTVDRQHVLRLPTT